MSRLPLAPLLAAAALPACAGPGQPATPQRPTVSSNTQTTAAGTFELEAGATVDPGDAFDLPLTFKYGLDQRTEAFVGFSPYRWVDLPGGDGSGIGDLVLGGRYRFVEETEKGPAVAARAAFKLPTADEDEGLGTGEFDATFAASFEKHVDAVGFVGYAELDVLGDPGGGTDLGQTLALAASTPVGDGLSAIGELSGIFVPDEDVSVVGLLSGVQYTVRPDLVLDGSLVLGLSSDAPDLLFLVGLTHNFGRP